MNIKNINYSEFISGETPVNNVFLRIPANIEINETLKNRIDNEGVIAFLEKTNSIYANGVEYGNVNQETLNTITQNLSQQFINAINESNSTLTELIANAAVLSTTTVQSDSNLITVQNLNEGNGEGENADKPYIYKIGVSEDLSDAVANIKALLNGDVANNKDDLTGKHLSDIIAQYLIPEDAIESLDTLKEIAAWIQEHPENVAAMNQEISALKETTRTLTTNQENILENYAQKGDIYNIELDENENVISKTLKPLIELDGQQYNYAENLADVNKLFEKLQNAFSVGTPDAQKNYVIKSADQNLHWKGQEITDDENNVFAKLLNISEYDEQDNSYTLSLTADAFEKFGQKIYTDAKTEAINESKAYIDDKLSWGVINNNE